MPKNAPKNAVVLLSGGLDSTTSAVVARSREEEIFALSFDYGQRNRAELLSAKKVADFLGVRRHLVFPLDLWLFGGSSLTAELPVVKDTPVEKIGDVIPNTYVPARNTVFLALGMAFAETVDATALYIGVNAVDTSGYPDCRPEFLDAFRKMGALATKAGVEGDPLAIETPLQNLSKAEIIRLGLSLGVDYALTHTCYDPVDANGLACGRCEACLLRLRGFAEAGATDPLPYDRNGA